MKTGFRILLAAIFAFSAIACSDDKTVTEPELDVNYANIAGTWKLTEWNNASSDAETYVYITFDRKEKTFVMYQNKDSFSSRKVTGSFVIYTDEELGAVLRGKYDYTNLDWDRRYIVQSLKSNRMVWVAKDDATDVSVYERSEVPSDVADPAEE